VATFTPTLALACTRTHPWQVQERGEGAPSSIRLGYRGGCGDAASEASEAGSEARLPSSCVANAEPGLSEAPLASAVGTPEVYQWDVRRVQGDAVGCTDAAGTFHLTDFQVEGFDAATQRAAPSVREAVLRPSRESYSPGQWVVVELLVVRLHRRLRW
jgi:hypothetical protein